jgi:hypothetical protein
VRQTRRLTLHWIAPFLVNRDLADDLVTVVRSARSR